MPSEASLKAVSKPPGRTPKGKPMGIPMWGWVIAAVIGIVVGYTILKKSGGVSPEATDSDGDGFPDGTEAGKGSPGGTIAIPSELLQALGLIPGNTESSTGDSGALETAEESSMQQSVSDPFIQEITAGGWTGAVDTRTGVPVSAGFGGFDSFGNYVDSTPMPGSIPVPSYSTPSVPVSSPTEFPESRPNNTRPAQTNVAV